MSDEPAECVVCDAIVRRLQQGLQCDICSRWQHRTCNSGITQEEYRRLRYEENFDWHCLNCSRQQTAESQDTSDDNGNAVVNEATFHVTLDSVTSTGGNESNTDSILEPDAHSTRILDASEEMDVDASFDVSCGMENDEPIEERQLFQYVEETWIDSDVWGIRQWSVFGLAVRTNNDVEGWHRRMIGKAGKAKLQFYVLVPLLMKEASQLSIIMRLVEDHQLTRYQRLTYRRIHGTLHELWGEYEEKRITTSLFLRRVGQVIAPGVPRPDQLP